MQFFLTIPECNLRKKKHKNILDPVCNCPFLILITWDLQNRCVIVQSFEKASEHALKKSYPIPLAPPNQPSHLLVWMTLQTRLEPHLGFLCRAHRCISPQEALTERHNPCVPICRGHQTQVNFMQRDKWKSVCSLLHGKYCFTLENL